MLWAFEPFVSPTLREAVLEEVMEPLGDGALLGQVCHLG